MKSSHGRILTILLAAVLVAFGANLAAYAANGGPLLLGKSNKATKVTKLKNSKGVALSLKSKTGKAPLQVNSSTTVTKLSADLLDGADGAAYRNQTFVYTPTGSSASTDTAWSLPGLPPGKYLATYSMVLSFTAAPTFVACYFSPATGSFSRWTAIQTGQTGTPVSFVSGSSYIDTTADPFVLGCEKAGGGTMTASPPPLGPAKIVLTRVDDVTSSAAGPPSTLVVVPKSGRPALQP